MMGVVYESEWVCLASVLVDVAFRANRFSTTF